MRPLRTAWLICVVSACLFAASCRHHVTAVAPATVPSGPVVLPPGTVLALVAAETIDSSQPSPTRTYAAVVSRDVARGTPQNVLPSGSPASVVLMQAGSSWQLGLSSIMLNGNAYLVKAGSDPAVPLGAYLGGVPGRDYPDLTQPKPGEPTGLIVSDSVMHIVPGSLVTFRLEREVTLIGSAN